MLSFLLLLIYNFLVKEILMNKSKFLITSLLAISLLTFCSKGKDLGKVKKEMVGKWQLLTVKIGDKTQEMEKINLIVSFNADGSYNSAKDNTILEKGKWGEKNNTVTISLDKKNKNSKTIISTITEISGEKMILTSQSPTSVATFKKVN